MRARLAIIVLGAALASSLIAGPSAGAAPANVVQPHLPRLGKEPAVVHLRHFLRSLRHKAHVSRRRHHALVVRKRHLGSAARDTLEARDRARRSFLKSYLAKRGRRHRARIQKASVDYYAYLRNLESHQARKILAAISDQIDRLAYS